MNLFRTVLSTVVASSLTIASVFSHAQIQADGYEHYIFFVHGYEDQGFGRNIHIHGDSTQNNFNDAVWFASDDWGEPSEGIGELLKSEYDLTKYANSQNQKDMTVCYLDIFKAYNLDVNDAHNTTVNPWGIDTFSTWLFNKITYEMSKSDFPNAPKKIDIVGHSMGGIIATQTVLDYKDLIGPWYGGEFNTVVTLGSPHLGVERRALCNSAQNGPCYEDVAQGSEYNIVAEQLWSGSSYMQALHHPTRDYSGVNWMLSAGASHNFYTTDSLVSTSSARAIGVDFGPGVNVSRKIHYYLNHALISGLEYISCDGCMTSITKNRTSVQSFLNDNF